MDFDLNQIISTQAQDLARERREVAKRVYESYSQPHKAQSISSASTVPQMAQKDEKISKKEPTSPSVEDSLKLVVEVSRGRTVKEVHDQTDIFRHICMIKMHNIFNSTLLKLSKTFLEVLPKNTCDLGVEEYKKTYFKSASLLAYYNDNGINVGDLFNKLMFIKKWLKQYSKYLSEGYGSDYLPENVVTILGELPDYHRHISALYENSHFTSRQPQKKAKTKEPARPSSNWGSK